jgi:methylated-DNA-[protein]-cysteine S-methyltransferase
MSNKTTKTTLLKAIESEAITQFQFEVYSTLIEVPAGKVTTYGEIAKHINCKSARAIGQALKNNIYAESGVPCHRVVRSDLTLGGFSGSTENDVVGKKVKLLESEGITFQKTLKETDYSELKVNDIHLLTL